MFCPQCGVKVLDDANFCHKCGTSLGSASKSPPSTIEVCEINIEVERLGYFAGVRAVKDRRTNIRFIAEVVGSNGAYIAHQTNYFHVYMRSEKATYYDPIIPQDDKEARAQLNSLSSKLMADGWTLVGTEGVKWFNRKFQRKI